ncbi:hypothetical protein OM416_20285 [Paenibacillus sp. LS1]|uniref:hypothetical protein n=1 Tax=Paenibacillus sp. LS1 TaxID=2992120 RepID=UPI002230A87E|nr:hypothetical protein [Paenibacillus sp. LS1]MCW3793936.1 hypothetical protein [Paenibacillus sp. LS1]
MTNHIRSWLFLGSMSILFVIGLATAINLSNETKNVLKLVSINKQEQDRTTYTDLKIPEQSVIFSSEVALTIAQIPDTHIDVEVNGILFSKTLEFEDIDLTKVPSDKKFIANYERNTAGEITKVKYTAQ